MKKIETLITQSKVDTVREALAKAGIKVITFSGVRSYGHHSSHVGRYQGSEYEADLLPEIKIEVVVEDDKVKEVTDMLIAALVQSGRLEDGEIFILPVDAVLHVRAGVC
jgi:nitrogen regulatory protein P-II 1